MTLKLEFDFTKNIQVLTNDPSQIVSVSIPYFDQDDDTRIDVAECLLKNGNSKLLLAKAAFALMEEGFFEKHSIPVSRRSILLRKLD